MSNGDCMPHNGIALPAEHYADMAPRFIIIDFAAMAKINGGITVCWLGVWRLPFTGVYAFAINRH
ncbi:hypothetical protein M8494_07370 [Serratia ureilytica]